MTTYVTPNFPTKKALKDAIAKGETVTFQEQTVNRQGRDFTKGDHVILDVCGPHFPKPHKWYAQVTIQDGKVTKVI